MVGHGLSSESELLEPRTKMKQRNEAFVQSDQKVLDISKHGSMSFADRLDLLRRSSSLDSPSPTGVSSGRKTAFPWGVNPVMAVSSVQTDNRRQVDGIAPTHLGIGAYASQGYVSHGQHRFAPTEDNEFVDTSSLSKGMEPLLEVIKSFFSFILGRGGSSEDSSSESSDSDIEIGLRKPLEHPENPTSQRIRQTSAFDELHSAPLRFPSSINELLGPTPTAYCFSGDSNLPSDPPPVIPALPAPRLRNELL